MAEAPARPRLAVSSCLLGEAVRYDGGHKRHAWLSETLAPWVDLRPICPEVGIGLGVPRPPIHLVGDAGAPRAVGLEDPTLDVSDALREFAHATVRQLGDIDAYLFKTRSPSCGLSGVSLLTAGGGRGTTDGVYAHVVRQALSPLPVAEEDCLDDPVQREHFVIRLYTYHRWRVFRRQPLTAEGLQGFHARHKYLLLAHDQAAYGRLGRMLARVAGEDLPALAARYLDELMQALRRPATRRGHTNALQHMAGHLKRRLGEERRSLAAAIEAYGCGDVPLIAPVSLLRKALAAHPEPYLQGQWYLAPYPAALGLRDAL